MRMLLWPVALLIAGAWVVSGRVHGGDPRILRGKLPRGLLRLVVLALVMLGAGKRAEAQAQPAATPGEIDFNKKQFVPLTVQSKPVLPVPGNDTVPRSAELPAALTAKEAENWARVEEIRFWGTYQHAVELARSPDANEQRSAAGVLKLPADAKLSTWMPPSLAKILATEITEDHKAPGPIATAELLEAATDLAKEGLYNPWVIGYLWHRSVPTAKPEEAKELAALYARLEEMARVDNALRLAAAQVGPITITGWMSKAGPVRLGLMVPANYAEVATKLYARADAGLWESEGVLTFRLPAGAAGCSMIRRGVTVPVKGGEFVQLRRLDILLTGEAEVAAEHRTLGKLVLPTKGMVTAKNAGGLVDEAGRKRIGEWVRAALEGDPDAVHLLEMALPVAAGTMREELGKHGTDRGAPAVRMLLDAFED